jgi:hypothetical protein
VSSDSSAKSIAASTCTRIASTCAISASTRRENTPSSERRAARAARVAGRDQVGDGLGLGEVELAVEEGAFAELAGRGLARAQRDAARHQLRSITGLPCACSSTTSSPVKLAGPI